MIRRVSAVAAVLCLIAVGRGQAVAFESSWPAVERCWIGPAFWANRLQDWQLANGRLECTTSGSDRNVGLLTRRVAAGEGTLTMAVTMGRLGPGDRGWGGFRVGAKGRVHAYPELRDHRDDVLRGKGLDCGITSQGRLFIGAPEDGLPTWVARQALARDDWRVVRVDSTQGGGERPEAALDGDVSTFWHSRYGSPPYPHEFQLDLGRETTVRAVAYMPRQDNAIGRIQRYRLYVSPSAETWGAAVAEGAFPNSTELQVVTVPPTRGRYVRLEALSDHVGRPAAAIAELHVFEREPGAQSDTGPVVLFPEDGVELMLRADPAGDACLVTLRARDARSGQDLAHVTRRVPAERLTGAVALVSHGGRGAHGARFWFRSWQVDGTRVRPCEEHAFGPILWSQYTLSRQVLKLTAQMPPLGEDDAAAVRLEVGRGGGWETVGTAGIDPLARTARFRVEDWDDSRDTPYRLVYPLLEADGSTRDHLWEGVIRRDPVDRAAIVVAAFTGNADYAFPNVDVVRHVAAHNPDVLFFSGDNVYEQVGGYGVERQPLERACLDYLRKWYCYGWAYRTLLRDRPTVSIPDDHDVYQGNIWGHGGRATDRDHNGGYVMPAAWVNMVQRTQTSHLPDPYDPTPVDQGITVYYCDMVYGGIGFAVLEDRKFKTGPAGLVPDTTSGRPDHVIDPEFDPATADVPGARLLGDRQLRFLEAWARDWRGATMKVTLSQTVFAGAATHHGSNQHYLVADYDANGWPQTGRNRALHEIRRAFAFMIGGDQHLATLIHHGIEDWNDAGWSFLVPSVANLYLRGWKPPQEPHRRYEGMPEYMGAYRDGFGNRITMWAATNPGEMGREPAWLHDRKPGYGIVRFRKDTREITVECWPRFADPRTDGDESQYDGWPRTIAQLSNYGRVPAAYLPTVVVRGMTDPVLQVVQEATGEVVYTVRIRGTEFRPKVFAEGAYTVHVGEQPDRMKTLRGVQARPPGDTGSLEVMF